MADSAPPPQNSESAAGIWGAFIFPWSSPSEDTQEAEALGQLRRSLSTISQKSRPLKYRRLSTHRPSPSSPSPRSQHKKSFSHCRSESLTSRTSSVPDHEQFLDGQVTPGVISQRPTYIRTFSRGQGGKYEAQTTPNMAYLEREVSGPKDVSPQLRLAQPHSGDAESVSLKRSAYDQEERDKERTIITLFGSPRPRPVSMVNPVTFASSRPPDHQSRPSRYRGHPDRRSFPAAVNNTPRIEAQIRCFACRQTVATALDSTLLAPAPERQYIGSSRYYACAAAQPTSCISDPGLPCCFRPDCSCQDVVPPLPAHKPQGSLVHPSYRTSELTLSIRSYPAPSVQGLQYAASANFQRLCQDGVCAAAAGRDVGTAKAQKQKQKEKEKGRKWYKRAWGWVKRKRGRGCALVKSE